MKLTILGGGLSAISLACFLQNREDIAEINILEKEDRAGGLCRTFETNGIEYDVGPHIIFSKDKEILDFMNGLLEGNIAQIRRSNRILHQKRFVQYPFENDLSKLPEQDKNYCVNAFLHNPYENYDAQNMLQFFLKTFGEGITNTYLRPYNEKIWKYDPSFMDTQMVDRIPKPPKEDILRSAAGETVEGYLHQLYFTYPQQGGTEALVKALIKRLSQKVKIHTGTEVLSVKKQQDIFIIETTKGSFSSERLVSTMPVNLLAKKYENTPEDIRKTAEELKYNSIVIAVVNVKPDAAKDNFAFMIADKEVKFHRLSKLDFLGRHYHKENSVSYMLEITYRKNDLTDLASDEEITQQIIDGLQKIGFISSQEDVNFTDLKRFEYAYVIYDLNHRRNMDKLKDYFKGEGINLNGRFGSFEYLNMDAVIKQSKQLADNF